MRVQGLGLGFRFLEGLAGLQGSRARLGSGFRKCLGLGFGFGVSSLEASRETSPHPGACSGVLTSCMYMKGCLTGLRVYGGGLDSRLHLSLNRNKNQVSESPDGNTSKKAPRAPQP